MRNKRCTKCNLGNRQNAPICIRCGQAFPYSGFYALWRVVAALSFWAGGASLFLLSITSH